jgi:hypothetical protein
VGLGIDICVKNISITRICNAAAKPIQNHQRWDIAGSANGVPVMTLLDQLNISTQIVILVARNSPNLSLLSI